MNKILSIQETKEGIIDFLYSRPEYVRHVHGDEGYGGEFQTRCPYCGDSQKEFNTGHFYVKIVIQDKSVIPCHCFKCNYNGILTPEALDLMGCNDPELKNGLTVLNKTGKYHGNGSYIEDQYRYFDRVMPDTYRYPEKLKYIDDRLGIDFTIGDYKDMKVVTSLYDFLIANDIRKTSFDKNARMMIERDYVGFLSSGNSHILFRDITNRNKFSWIKFPIDEESAKNKVWYGIATELDVLTNDEITVNMAEGVMDIIGVYKHINTSNKNVMNVAITGQNYNAIILHLINIGLVGGNVTINIYADNDATYGNKSNRASTEKFLRKYLDKYKPLYRNINIYYNLKGKDYGVKKEDIMVKKITI